MRTLICLKPVPDPKHWGRLRLDPRTKTLIREGIPNVMNPLDKNALEAGLRLREESGGEVIILSMAPPSASPVLREALAMGADRAVLLSDPAFAGSDTLATSYILACAVQKLAPFHFVLCGDQTLDGNTGQVSAQMAEFLDIPNIMHVTAIESADGDNYRIRSRIEQGCRVLGVKPPVVLSVVKQINEPRYITLINILEGEKKEIQIWSSKELALTEPWVGLRGSPSQMADLLIPAAKRKLELLQGSPSEMAASLANRLHRLGFI
jgi:electron transfer flavoprotein beta subunit